MNVHQRAIRAADRISDGEDLQGSFDKPSLLSRLLPHGRTQKMMQETRGVFIPYPLLGIIITITCMVIAGIIAIEVQVSSLNTTLLLRDADQRAEILTTKEKMAQLEVYIHSDREKLVRMETQLENDRNNKRRQ